MRNNTYIFYKISTAIIQINKFLKEDDGKLIINSFSDDYVLNLSFEGACKNCKKNNLYFKSAIQDMIEETLFGVNLKIQYN